MIDNILRNVPQTEQGTAHMETTGNTCSHVNIVSNALHLGCICEIARANDFPHQIVVVLAATIRFETQLGRNINELSAHLLDLAQRLGLQEMLSRPLCAEVVFAPLLVDI